MLPLIRNIGIRIVALLEQLWRAIIGVFGGLFGAFGRLLGVNNPGYYVDNTPTSKADAQPAAGGSASAQSATGVSSYSAPARPTKRQSTADMEYFRKMAKQIKTPD